MNTVEDILEQIKGLNMTQRKQLVKAAIDLLDESISQPQRKTGAEIVAWLEAMDNSIELVDPEIEDPVEWVKAQRRKRTDQLQSHD